MRINEILNTYILPNSTTARLDLEVLLTEALQKSRNFLYAYSEYELTNGQQVRFQNLYNRRLQGEPIAYILGRKEFWSLELIINNQVLIPRPETELLVEVILNKINFELANVADLGTGSGSIALAIAKARPKWSVVATDISQGALQVAKSNAIKLQIPKVKFYCGDWCNALPDTKFDVIVSNPPYIVKTDPHLLQGDVKFEPRLALENEDGLDAIRKIIIQAKSRLKPKGLLVLEHGYNQSEIAQELLQTSGYQEIVPYKDLSNIYRAITAKR